jgi:hypothetical protein
MEIGRRGEHDAAIGVIDRTTGTYESIPDHRMLACMLGLRCFNLRKLGRLAEAEQSCKQALLLQKKHRLTGTISTFALLAAAELRLEQFEAGLQQAGARHAATVAVKAMIRQGRRVRDQGAVESQRVAGTFEWLCGERKRALSFWSKGLDEAKALGARHAEGRIFFERGRRTGSDDDLQRAALLFQQCGALGEQRELEAFLAGCARTSRPSAPQVCGLQTCIQRDPQGRAACRSPGRPGREVRFRSQPQGGENPGRSRSIFRADQGNPRHQLTPLRRARGTLRGAAFRCARTR